ncbi:MAG: SIMPL domain-containing protein [Acidimicrobiia bacterium]
MPNDEDGPRRTLVVVGHGEASAVPDRCTISAALRVMSESVADAISGVASLADAAWTALRESGVPESDLHTHNVHVQDWIDREQQQVTARVAMYTFTVDVRNLREVSSVVALLVATVGDALQIQAIGFSHSDHGSLLAVARRDAVADARLRAEQLAEAAAVKIGHILAIDEGATASAGWAARAVSGGLREVSGPAMPMNPGSQGVTARVVVTYALTERQ